MTPAERRTRAKAWRKWFPDLLLSEWHGTRCLGPFEVATFATEGGSWVALAILWPVVDGRPLPDVPPPERLEVVAVCSDRTSAESARDRRFLQRLASVRPGRFGGVELAAEPEQLPLLGLDPPKG